MLHRRGGTPRVVIIVKPRLVEVGGVSRAGLVSPPLPSLASSCLCRNRRSSLRRRHRRCRRRSPSPSSLISAWSPPSASGGKREVARVLQPRPRSGRPGARCDRVMVSYDRTQAAGLTSPGIKPRGRASFLSCSVSKPVGAGTETIPSAGRATSVRTGPSTGTGTGTGRKSSPPATTEHAPNHPARPWFYMDSVIAGSFSLSGIGSVYGWECSCSFRRLLSQFAQ